MVGVIAKECVIPWLAEDLQCCVPEFIVVGGMRSKACIDLTVRVEEV
jgi:hypothetical protein